MIEALANLKQYDEALEQVNTLIKRNPGSIAFALRAQLYARLGKVDEAIRDCDQALKDNADDLAARMLRAQLYFQQHKNALAADDIKYVLKARPGVPQALGLSALIHAAQGDIAKAIDLMKAVAEQDPTELGWKLQLATLYQMAKQPRQSIAVYDKILESEPDQPDALRGRADVLLSLGEHAKAVVDYRHALKASPDDATLLNNLAWVLATSPETKVRNGEQALQLAKKAQRRRQNTKKRIFSARWPPLTPRPVISSPRSNGPRKPLSSVIRTGENKCDTSWKAIRNGNRGVRNRRARQSRVVRRRVARPNRPLPTRRRSRSRLPAPPEGIIARAPLVKHARFAQMPPQPNRYSINNNRCCPASRSSGKGSASCSIGSQPMNCFASTPRATACGATTWQ